MTNVLLVNPPALRPGGPGKEPLGLGYLAAVLRQNDITAEIIDAPSLGLDHAALACEIKKTEFEILAVSIIFQDALGPTLDWLSELRDGGLKAHITIGGHPATFTYREVLESYHCVDSIVRGEGEFTLLELASKIDANDVWRDVPGLVWRDGPDIIKNESRALIPSLDDLPWPARDVLAAAPGKFEHLTVIGSRGCPANCSFCSIATFYRSFKGPVWRRRDPNDLLDEIDAARRRFPTPFVLMFDDSFIGPGNIGREQAFEFADALSRRRPDYLMATSCRADQVEEELFGELRRAGIAKIFLGIESGNDETLGLMNKNCTVEINRRALEILDKLGFSVEIGFIMFNPYTTFSQIRHDLDFLLDTGIGPDQRHLSNLGLFPGQPILEVLRNDGLLDATGFELHAKFANPRLGLFFESIRDTLFAKRGFPGLNNAFRLIEADRLEFSSPGRAAIEAARGVIGRYNRAVYDSLNDSATLFETGHDCDRSVTQLAQSFAARCAAIDEEARGTVSPAGTSS